MAPRSTSFAQYAENDSHNAPLEQYAAMPPWFRDIAPDDLETWDECHLPELHGEDPLPLAYWEGLFYALIAEIRYLYSDLQLRFGGRFEQGNRILHHYGRDARTKEPFSVVEFARLLEICWDKTTCPYLTAALDYAIMQRAAFVANGETPTLYSMMKFQGLSDVGSMDPVQIIRWLAEKQATEVKVAVRRNEPDIPGLVNAHEAMCARREEIKHRQQAERALAGAQSDSSGDETRASTPIAQRRLLPNVTASPIDTDSQTSGTERPLFPRGRLAHKPSNLAYVVDKNNSPTKLYRDHSGQRYPQEATKPHAEGSITSPPVFAPMYHAMTTPDISRKPVPLVSADDEGLFMKDTPESGRLAKASMNTKPSTQEHTSPETQPTSPIHASFDSMVHGRSFNLSVHTQSFPAFDDTRPLPPTLEEEHEQTGEQAQYDDSTLKARTLLARARPSTSPTIPSPTLFTAPRSNTLPTSSSPFGQHDQASPLPRPSLAQQRYVSAGGHTPLHERDVMQDFQLPASMDEQTETFSMNKEDFYAQLATKNQMEDMTRAEGARKASKASKASTTTSEKREKSFTERFRVFRKSSRAEEDQ